MEKRKFAFGKPKFHTQEATERASLPIPLSHRLSPHSKHRDRNTRQTAIQGFLCRSSLVLTAPSPNPTGLTLADTGRGSTSPRRPGAMGYAQEARENHVKKKVQEALRSKMKQKALKECDQYTRKYAECAAGRTISVVWQCRKQAKGLNECLHQYTKNSVLEEMKKKYMVEQEKGRG